MVYTRMVVRDRTAYNKKYYAKNAEKFAASNKAYNVEKKAEKAAQQKAFMLADKQNHPEKYLFRAAKQRARVKGLEFNIEESDIVVPDVCPILGIPLFVGFGTQTDNSPSLDRIDPMKGYIKGNIMVVSYRANTIKSNATVAELRSIADWMEEHAPS